MWGIVVSVLALGSVGALADSSHKVMGRLSWCTTNTLCMCETETNATVHCYEEDDVFEILGVSTRQVSRLRRTNWSLQTKVYWCSDLCLCNIQTGKNFKCAEPGVLTQLIVNNIGTEYFITPNGESDIKQETERSVDQLEDPSLDHEADHRGKAGRKKNRKNNRKKNQRQKHRKHSSDLQAEPEPEPEPQAEPEPDVHTTTMLPPVDSWPTAELFSQGQTNEGEDIKATEEPEPLPRQEAVAASPAVTALQPPTRQMLPYSTAESYTPRASPRDVEGLPPRVQPVVEVPKEKKTMASRVSQDLDDLDTTVRNIKNDVMLNQRILLVTVAIAGVAMLGVLILAILSCTNRRQAANAAKKRDANKEGNHSPKVNLEEAW